MDKENGAASDFKKRGTSRDVTRMNCFCLITVSLGRWGTFSSTVEGVLAERVVYNLSAGEEEELVAHESDEDRKQ
jgi:hypothetical protein